jgi:serine/threonine protein kinase
MQTLEGYEVLDRLGEGSFGEVFLAVQKATDESPERKVRPPLSMVLELSLVQGM